MTVDRMNSWSQRSKVKGQRYERSSPGFALLVSVITATIILTIGASVANNALKEVVLASTVRNSLVSLYMADSGTECFLYWDNIRGRFGVDSAFVHGSSISEIECGGIANIEVDQDGIDKFAFWLRPKPDAQTPCAYITKKPKVSDPGTILARSWGFNTCDPDNTRRVDRAFELKFR